jgi:hypothetical protein
MRSTFLICIVILALPVMVTSGTTWQVPGHYPTIQSAINDAAVVNGDTIELVSPSYSGVGNRNIKYNGKAITIKSQSGNPTSCTIDCGSADRGFWFSGEGSGSVLEGVKVTNGLKTGIHETGGGLYFQNGSTPIIRNCIITGNAVSGDWVKGGGVYCWESSPTFDRCTITDNEARGAEDMNTVYGAGVYLRVSSNAVFDRCIISENTASSGGPQGAGVYIYDSSPTFTNCRITDNLATPGGSSNGYGAGVNIVGYSVGASPVFTCCTIAGNVAGGSYPYGGGMHCSSCSPVVTTTIIAHNQGGGLYFETSAASSFDYCDIGENTGGGGNIKFSSDNPANGPAGIGSITTTNANGDNCDVYKNIFLSADFLNLSGSDFHLEGVSRCIGAGDPTGMPANDLEGSTRPNPGGSTSDIGAYEHPYEAPVECAVFPTSIDFDTVAVNSYADMNFSITNTGGGTLNGYVNESCSHYSIQAGGGAFSLGAGQSVNVTIRFAPTSAGTKTCTIHNGTLICTDVSCTGVGRVPLAVGILSFSASGFDDRIEVEWTTATETDNAGFNVYRSQDKDGGRMTINSRLILARGDEVKGAEYSYVDYAVQEGTSYYYWLEDVDLGGKTMLHGPVTVCTASVSDVPGMAAICQSRPNPFSGTTEIKYGLRVACRVSLGVYDLMGRRVRTLAEGHEDAGYRVVTWDGRNDDGIEVSGGVYFYRLEAGNHTEMLKVVHLR